MSISLKSLLNRNSQHAVHLTTGRWLPTFGLLCGLILLQGATYAAEKPDGVNPTVTDTIYADYFFPLSGFPDCTFKSSVVSHTSYDGIPAIGYTEYLRGQPYLTGYELLPDPDLSPAKLYTDLSSKFSELYGKPAVQTEQKAYPEPDNRLQIWFNAGSQTRVFLNLRSNINQKKCYIAFVNYN